MTRHPRQSGVAPATRLLCAGIAFLFGLAGWASEARRDQPYSFATLAQEIVTVAVAAPDDATAQATLDAEWSGRQAAQDRLPQDQAGVGSDDLGQLGDDYAVKDVPAQPGASVAPSVEVRVGDHGEFERVVFEWPEAVEHDVVRRADQVIVDFGRPGKIDLAQVRDRFGERVVEAFAEGGETTRRVVLRVAPDASIRSFSLENDRIVVLDVRGGSAPRTVALPVPRPDPRPTESAVHEQVTRIEPSKVVPHAPSRANDGPLSSSAPTVAVRVGEHGAFERVVFEWPEAIGHEVVQRADRVTVAFSRPGRIDLSRVRDRFGGRVIEAWVDGSDATSQVVLRVLPNANIRSFSLKNERVVVVDVFEEPTPPHLAQHAPDPAQDPIRELRRELEQRDAAIDSLLARVEQLERDVVLSGGDLDRVVAGQAGATPSAGDPSLARAGAPSVAAAEQPPGEPASEQNPTAAGEGQDSGNATAQAQPGQFDVAEEDIDRALERTLVQTGALLLPWGQAEIESYFSYTRRENKVPVLFVDTGIPGLSEQEVRRDEFVSGQTLRVGLPFDSQVELDLPYRYVQQSVVTPVGFGQRDDEDGSGGGFGDLRIGVAKTLLRENGGWWPDLVARGTWDTDTGETTANDVVLGGGFHELRGSLSAIKRQDPLAFVGGLSYEKTFESNDVEPGDELGFSIGTVLAASPGTSLRLALGQSFIDNSKVDGESVEGSDRVVGTATLGASVVLGRGILLDVAADIGLTDDAPDYAARASLPIRFNLPVY